MRDWERVCNEPVSRFVARLKDKDITLWIDDGTLRCKAPKNMMNGDVLQKIRSRKEEIIDFLSNEDTDEKLQKMDSEQCGIRDEEESHEIDNIEPYNDMFYKNCFYNSFFPIVRHFGRSITPYFANDLAIYSGGNSSNAGLSVKYFSALSTERLILEEGLSSEAKKFGGDVFDCIRSSVSRNDPVIAWIDCFYEPVSLDMYKKNHWPHTILIFGFDDGKKAFITMEHTTLNSLSYEKRSIKYRDMSDMLKGFAENYCHNESEPSFVMISETRKNAAPVSRWLDLFRKNILDKEDMVTEGLGYLRSFLSKFRELTKDGPAFFANGGKIISSLNAVINAKTAEKYKLDSLLGSNGAELSVLLANIAKGWGTVRNSVARSVYAGVYDTEKLKHASEILNGVYLMEIKYNKTLAEYIRDIRTD